MLIYYNYYLHDPLYPCKREVVVMLKILLGAHV